MSAWRQPGEPSLHTRWQEILNISAQIVVTRDLDELCRRVAELILSAYKYYYVGVFILEPGQEVLHLRASAGPRREASVAAEQFSPAPLVQLGEGIIGRVAQTGVEILANNLRQEANSRQLQVLPETCSEVALPLKVGDRLLGVLDVQSDQVEYFDQTDVVVLRILAGNIAFAVEGACLYSSLHRRSSQLAAIYEVSRAITSILDQEQLLADVADLIHNRFGYKYVHLLSVHPGRGKIFYQAGSGPRSLQLREDQYAYDLDDPQGLIPWVARHGETVLVNDISKEPRYRPSPLPPDETLSELTVPLVFGGEVLGILDVQSEHLNAFGEEDRFLFEALADNIAIAMRNAALYRSESWRRRVADSLREVAGLLSADVDLGQVLEAILLELERTLPLDMAAIWLLDEDSLDETSDGCFPLRLAAYRGAGTAGLDLEIGYSPKEVLDFNPSGKLEMPSEEPSNWLIEALESGNPVVRSPQSPYEPLGAALDFPTNYSAIAAPLRIGEQSLGVLSLAHRTSGRYGGESRAMTEAFASYAAIAIENTRLYEVAHEQAWISTVLLQVAEATQSLSDLNELLETVMRITPMLAGVKACLLYILDDDGVFLPTGSSGLRPAQQAEFERWRFFPGDVPALDRLHISSRPVVVSDEADDLCLSGIFLAGEESDASLDYEFLVLVPLLVRGEVLGAFLIDYSADMPGGGRGKSVEELFSERLAIVQGIAHQTAIAMDNLRLLKSQKEEAYLSVALLQVAQAVVNSKDLDETLGSIVRITPILAGVERAAIYLWNAEQAAFFLSQVYGIPRPTGEHRFALGEFPLLDAVLLQDSLLACSLEGESSPSDDVLGTWSHLAVPEPEDVHAYLENETHLLIAFPLSVKGKVLGVLLVEEPGPTSIEGFSIANANRRLREKRLEIITGISQQAALSIQNDHLQREMVERERLEREMQLAREIQATFLPQRLPDLPGWELRAYWRPAHEVGGDFYDFFELPGGRLGLVIADVADKGMPAALYMTLVRTLVRAAVQEISSPAEVLERVNDLLVPDAPQGMFVTLVYAVLSLETKDLKYANAGHNLPLLLRSSTFQIERLEKGGMALGVLEGNRIQDHCTSLESGDFLIMYTDGVTEAFSPEGDLYSEERLCQTIGQAAIGVAEGEGLACLTAQEMLTAIDSSVLAFIGDGMPTDDLTLLILKRIRPG